MEKKPSSGLMYALSLAWDLGYIIALPIVILGFGGAYADKHFTSSPLFLLIGIGLALTITAIGVYRKVMMIMVETDASEKKI